jgi:acyl-CoA thioester hydrolase
LAVATFMLRQFIPIYWSCAMSEYRFFHPIEVRYADIDAQRHVNNACYFVYMEQARGKYVQHLGLWNGEDFEGIGFILAEQSCTYKAPIAYTQRIHVGVRTTRIGNKSFEVAYSVRELGTGQEMASGRTVLVAYDYELEQSIPIPDRWRQTIREFEGLD